MKDFIRVDTVLRMNSMGDDKDMGLSRIFTREDILAMNSAPAVKQHIADEVARQFLLAMSEAQVRVTDGH
jgi:hypothetical protein